MNLCLRRSIVRAAEEDCARRGVKFHGRFNFIYARNVKGDSDGDSFSFATEFVDRSQHGAGWSPSAAPDTDASISGDVTLMAMQKAIERLADEQVRMPSESAI